jgi:hypothetical protein
MLMNQEIMKTLDKKHSTFVRRKLCRNVEKKAVSFHKNQKISFKNQNTKLKRVVGLTKPTNRCVRRSVVVFSLLPRTIRHQVVPNKYIKSN